MEELKPYKKLIDQFITSQLQSVANNADVVDKMLPFVLAGKGIRGSMVMLIHDLYKGTNKQRALEAGSALELMNSGILMADDIIDRDTMRRDLPTIHVQYERQIGDRHYAEGFASTLALMTTYQALAAMKNQPKEVIELIAHEMTLCGTGQMQEMNFTVSKKASVDEVLQMYENKTAHYTFTLPITIGAILAGVDKEELQKLKELSIHLGLLFQLRDDLIEKLGSNITGKSRSDESNNTLTIPSLVGDEKTKQMIEEREKSARDVIATLSVQEPFLKLLQYLITRTK